ncbi:MAG TPA: alcohol dehydrogenase AdhP [Ilumatobacter sp.]|jgi:alcohol dehydrogenase, propanol-preferring|nr:alcohol dehydrogenase AdhP [Ilumatobacter sp.]
MRVAVVRELGGPLTIEDRPLPEPAANQVLVRLEASGLCHTDIHAAHGDWVIKPTPPFVPGHEGIGIVQAVGSGVRADQVGQRVAVPWLHTACGRCKYCVSGWETLCLSQSCTGYTVDGCYGEFVLADADFVVQVPRSIDPLEAAPLTCAGVTTYKAVKVSGARPSEVVAVFGVGGLGHLALQYAKIAGATVVAVDVSEDKLTLAKSLGADLTINARTMRPQDVMHDQFGGADVVITTAADAEPLRAAFESLCRHGRLVLVGLPADNEMRLPVFETVLGGISVIGSIVGTRRDLEEVFALHASGRTRVVYETRRLEQVNEAFAEVLAGQVDARLVFDLST